MIENIHIGTSALTNRIYLYRATKKNGVMGEKRPCEPEIMKALIEKFEWEKTDGMTFTLNEKQYRITLKEVK